MIGIRIKPTEFSMVKIIDVVVVVSPILKMTFLPEAQRYVTMAALRAPFVRLRRLKVATSVWSTSMNFGRHVTGLQRGVVSPAPRRGVHRPISAGERERER